MKVYVIMEAGWVDNDSNSEEVSLSKVYSSEKSAVKKIEELVKDRYDWSFNKYHEEPIIETDTRYDWYEKTVWDGDKHAYIRWWIEEQIVEE